MQHIRGFCKKNTRLCQNSSTLQISHRVPVNLTPSKKHKLTRDRASNKLRLESTSRHWLVVIANRNPAFSIRHEGTQYEMLVDSSRMSYILICVRVALAASDVQIILDPATDVLRLAREQLHFNKAKIFRSKFLYLD